MKYFCIANKFASIIQSRRPTREITLVGIYVSAAMAASVWINDRKKVTIIVTSSARRFTNEKESHYFDFINKSTMRETIAVLSTFVIREIRWIGNSTSIDLNHFLKKSGIVLVSLHLSVLPSVVWSSDTKYCLSSINYSDEYPHLCYN